MAVKISISIYQNGQSTANNTSNVTVQVTASWTGGSYNHFEKPGTLVIDGKSYAFSSPFNINNTTSGTSLLYSKTLDIAHTPEGTKALSCSASYTSGVSSGTVTASASKVLTPISRGSTISAAKGTLGKEQTLTVTRKSSSFTHTVEYSCGSVPKTPIVSKSSSTSIKWTPLLDLAKQNPNGNSVSITLTVTTYNGSSAIGSYTTSFVAAIPAIKPTASMVLSDPTGLKTTYGGYVQRKSKLKVLLAGTGNLGSTIKNYKIKVGGDTYSGSEKTVELTAAGALAITGTVTDSRTQSGEAVQDIVVLAYSGPRISGISSTRCTQNGTPQADGAYAKVTFSAGITPLNNRNSATYSVEYRKEGVSSWSSVAATAAAGNYAPSNVSVIFAADPESAFEVRVVAADDFGEVSSSPRTVPIAFALLQGDTTGTGLAIGQMATEPGVFAVGIPTKIKPGGTGPALDVTGDINGRNFYGYVYGLGKAKSTIPAGANFNDYTDFGVYAVTGNATAEKIANCPVKYAGTLVVLSGNGTGETAGNYVYMLQIYRTYDGIFECVRGVSTDNTGEYRFSDWRFTSSIGWIHLGLSANVSTSGSNFGRTEKSCYYRVVDENHVFLSFNCALSYAGSAIRVNANLIPENYRPARNVYAVCPVSGRALARVLVNNAGEIFVEWVQSLSSGSATSAFDITWIDGYLDYWI